MPKIRDLGINVIPETMRPPEMGPGGGCNAGTYGTDCPATTFPTTPFAGGYTCPGTTIPFPSQHCYAPTCPGTTLTFPSQQCHAPTCPGTTFTNPSLNCYPNAYPNAAQTCPGGTFATTGRQADYAVPCPATTFAAPSHTCYPNAAQTCPGTTIAHNSQYCAGQPLTREAIARLKEQLQQQLAQLDEYAKSLGPKTPADIEARERQLQAELEELARLKKEYQGKE